VAQLQKADTRAGHVEIEVRDDGVGMDEATRARIFEPFFSTKGMGKGLGLGLATVFGIVKQSGGHVTVESKPGHGSTFRLYLPATASATTLTAAISATDDVPGGTETILLVDDNLEVRTVVSALLRQMSYTVLEAGSGREALEVCGAHAGPIDLLLTDVAMPEADGEEVARRLLTARPDLKVLYMSGYSDSAVASHGVLHQGAAVVLHKPFTGPQLLRTVRSALNDRSS